LFYYRYYRLIWLMSKSPSTHYQYVDMRSAAAGQLLVPCRTSSNIGRRDFHCCGPAMWNALSVCLRTDNRILWRLWQTESTEETPVQHLM